MTDLGDEFVAAAHKVGLVLMDEETTPEMTAAASAYLENVGKHCPALEHVSAEAGRYTMRLMRRQYRAMSGVPFTSNQDAMEKMQEVVTHLSPVYLYFFALGEHLGEQNITDPEEIRQLADGGNNLIIQGFALPWATEEQVMRGISGFMYGVFNSMCDKIHYEAMPAEMSAPKIWDVCWFSTKIIFQQVFCVGWEIGVNRRVLAELAAIAEASGGLDVE